MDKPRVLCMVNLAGAGEGLSLLRKVAEVDVRDSDRSVLLDTIAEYDAFWGHTDLKVDTEVLERTTRLRVVNTASTGTDHIDKDEAARRGIRVLSITRDYTLLDTFTATAELAWLLMIGCHRHLRRALQDVFNGRWYGERFQGRQLSDETLGVLGVGRLGRMVCEFGKAFRMRVLGCDLKPFEIPGVQPVDFDTLLREADAVSIHIHLLPQNVHLFDRRTFGRMKSGAILVNASRGDIIDEEALLEALESGKIAAFGADVLHDEWRIDMRESPVIRYAQNHDNVIITPHMGGASTTSVWNARNFSAQKLAHYLETGEELQMA